MSDSQPRLEAMYQLWERAVAGLSVLGLEGAVLAPGSRSAPLALSFLRSRLKRRVMVDERSAAYAALGWAKAVQRPVALVCTSGTAALNFSPAIAEAYWQQIPLLVFTADRPASWIGRNDNQTIYQEGLYGKHVRWSGRLDPDYGSDDAPDWMRLQLSRAFRYASHPPCGPVHLNVPLAEPLYQNTRDDSTKAFKPIHPMPMIRFLPGESDPTPTWLEEDPLPNRVLLLCGMQMPAPKLSEVWMSVAQDQRVAMLIDPLANVSQALPGIGHDEAILKERLERLMEDDRLRPDWIFEWGGPWVGKRIKTLLRIMRPERHLRFDRGGGLPDLFQHLTDVAPGPGMAAMNKLRQRLHNQAANQTQPAYQELWRDALRGGLDRKDSELEVVRSLLERLNNYPVSWTLHWGNSTPVRHWQALHAAGVPCPSDALHVANRGASGIDGCLSTAVGMAWAQPERIHVLIIGDLSFQYDANGLFHDDLPGNLRILILNNGGGGIFRRLPGAAAQPEREEYFVAAHARKFSDQFHKGPWTFFHADSRDSFDRQCATFLTPQNHALHILEYNC